MTPGVGGGGGGDRGEGVTYSEVPNKELCHLEFVSKKWKEEILWKRPTFWLKKQEKRKKGVKQ